ncbi:hypothetical protein K3G39_12740 [Pontibacter sp. HSC-14F20]|uniref:hypothetical protein n=1 Tax=Pontibacter sp. HSC-14F20 TaxID=2864136 RepID=UPI001C72A6E9|nr:hypothetical protein [Pontibacter sp. HSC-14F20]MBX0334104.1 hypothetical protein [Pontibacter sp. HSC-14F20]
MENKMNYTKAIILLVSGILAIAASRWLGAESGAYGFLIGYGYAALVGGVLGIGYSYFKMQKAKKGEVTQ